MGLVEKLWWCVRLPRIRSEYGTAPSPGLSGATQKLVAVGGRPRCTRRRAARWRRLEVVAIAILEGALREWQARRRRALKSPGRGAVEQLAIPRPFLDGRRRGSTLARPPPQLPPSGCHAARAAPHQMLGDARQVRAADDRDGGVARDAANVKAAARRTWQPGCSETAPTSAGASLRPSSSTTRLGARRVRASGPALAADGAARADPIDRDDGAAFVEVVLCMPCTPSPRMARAGRARSRGARPGGWSRRASGSTV